MSMQRSPAKSLIATQQEDNRLARRARQSNRHSGFQAHDSTELGTERWTV